MIMNRCLMYLRASTKEQDPERARFSLTEFAAAHQLDVVKVYTDTMSGTVLDRPQLMALLDEAQGGDVLLCEAVDRLSRMDRSDWKKLQSLISEKGLRLVVANLPTTHLLIDSNEVTGAFLTIINDLLLDILATQAAIDQKDRIVRIREGLANKRRRGEKVGGRGRNQAKWLAIEKRLKENLALPDIAKLCDVGIATVYRVRAELNKNQ